MKWCMSEPQEAAKSLLGIHVEITRFLDESWPGYVECRLVDCAGEEWFFYEKVPVVAADGIHPNSKFPLPGFIACRVVEKSLQADGRDVVRIDTEIPWHIESTDGKTHFDVFADQLRTA